MHREFCKFITKTPRKDLLDRARAKINRAEVEQKWNNIIMYEPLLTMMTCKQNNTYTQFMYQLFLKALRNEDRISEPVPNHLKRLRIKNMMLDIYKKSADLYGEDGFPVEQGKQIMDFASTLKMNETNLNINERVDIFPYLLQVSRMAHESGSYTLESLADTAIGMFYCEQGSDQDNEAMIEEGLHYLNIGADAAIMNFDPGFNDIYIVQAINALLWKLFHYSNNNSKGRKRVDDLIEEYEIARINMSVATQPQENVLQWNIDEMLLKVGFSEVSHCPTHELCYLNLTLLFIITLLKSETK